MIIAFFYSYNEQDFPYTLLYIKEQGERGEEQLINTSAF